MNDLPSGKRILVASIEGCAGWACRSIVEAGSGAVVGVLIGDGEPGGVIEGAPVLGGIGDLPSIGNKNEIDVVVACLPRAMGGVLDQLRADCEDLGVALRVLPTITDVLDAPARLDIAADANVLIGRSPRPFDPTDVERLIRGNRVLITGAGGSIGSELARLSAQAKPERLILMDRSENSLFEIQGELKRKSGDIETSAVLHDIVDPVSTLRRFEQFRPDVVFHAAAHKHVPMMEDHPAAAVRNNVVGTRSVADAARAVGTERFVMISTDKAVNPTSIMGATKQLAERYIQSLPQGEPTRFAIVRFGNVLGSACSVLPIWQRQLEEGGPITITHPEMTRYFMTIREAASLVIRAADIQSSAEGADVFVLDMGEPVKIVELAERFVRANGLEPRWDDRSSSGRPTIRLSITGIRPGEKIHEQLAHDHEMLAPTAVPGVLQYRVRPEAAVGVAAMVEELSSAARVGEVSTLLGLVSERVPTLTGSKQTPASAA